jgi:hypothetical protein
LFEESGATGGVLPRKVAKVREAELRRRHVADLERPRENSEGEVVETLEVREKL